ncbi:uncharacterized protein BBA_03430 [Beauveria bassiana ARSEF 2860]|uniref:Uncharacterized protein n=1 Tax=Beauveria bassiana (strain ARSEF 2860) TaxID=655819 RepID=J4WC40_BEAB2|nr:uncharacterized protein BBA_03430 [Beauveria bassiana ARSEF 2860]EJP67650.1 hypothetical protein BBA_03430 [Beauveria bassiana ARSEF 2860]
MNKTPQLSKLESLNYDTRLAILGSCESFKDLAALIRASPTLYHTFLANKAPLLLSVVGNILGPAARDAAMLAKTRLDKSKDFLRRVAEVAQDYKAHLRVAGLPWVTGLDAETAVALTHITRDTQFCVDMYGHIQRWQFIHELDLSEREATISGRPRLSRNERIRIAQAILRRQVLELIFRRGLRAAVDLSQSMRAFMPLFRTWEWQQISDMDHFITFLFQWLDLDMDELLSFINKPDLEAIVQNVKIVLNPYDASLESMQKLWLSYAQQTHCGILHFLEGSHRLGALLPNDSQHSNTFGDDDDSGPEPDIDDQPWAWRDALCGNDTCRWGMDLIQLQLGHEADMEQYSRLGRALVNWRSFGMVFWDRDRVERMKATRQLNLCQTGWLIPWQDKIKTSQ